MDERDIRAETFFNVEAVDAYSNGILRGINQEARAVSERIAKRDSQMGNSK